MKNKPKAELPLHKIIALGGKASSMKKADKSKFAVKKASKAK
jgi:hypothetical protein